MIVNVKIDSRDDGNYYFERLIMNNDQGILKRNHEIITEVARLAWNNELDEDHKIELGFKFSPGIHAAYRCCVFKEREIIRQKIRLCEGKEARPTIKNKGVIQVIDAACADCPKASYAVTDNCRSCIGKACYNSCKFGAISIFNKRPYIDPEKCKECGMCANACPYNSIIHLERPCKKACDVGAITYNDDGICEIDDEKCIECGHCVHSCPFTAIVPKNYVVDVATAIRTGKEVYAMVAPAFEGQFGSDITLQSVLNACEKVGFAGTIEVAVGADMTAAYEAEEWIEGLNQKKVITTSCCPAFINMIKKHFPEIYDENMSKTVSPMCAMSRYLKTIHPECITVFIGPCVAKKSEANDKSIKGNADYVLSFREFQDLIRAKGVELEPAENNYQEGSLFGKKFATSGGVASAVLEVMKEINDVSEVTYKQCAGAKECKNALTMLKMGKLTEDFIEGMICVGGCVGGPSKEKTEIQIRRDREQLLLLADDRKILDNVRKYPMDKFSMNRNNK